jgi:mRNA interferase MazF
MRQSEVWLADLGGAAGRRPVVILTRNNIIPQLSKLTVMPLTTNVRQIPTHVRLTRADGMREVCAATADNIGTFEKSSLLYRLAQLSPEKMLEIFQAIRVAFDMPP